MEPFLIGVACGPVFWFLFLAPLNARSWHQKRKELGLPPKEPPGLVGVRERMSRKIRG